MKLFTSIFVLLLLVGTAYAFDFNLQKQDSGIVSGLEGSILGLTVDGDTEIQIQIDRVGSQRIMTTLLSNQKVIIFDLGQAKEVDLDGDGVNDVKIDVNNIIDKLVSFKITKIGSVENTDTIEDLMEEIDEDIEEIEDTGLEEVTGAVPGVSRELGVYTKWVLGIIIVVIVLIIVVFVYRGGENSDRFYTKAMDLHREGQEFHWDGDDETAEELYEKAGELREKARNLEGGF